RYLLDNFRAHPGFLQLVPLLDEVCNHFGQPFVTGYNLLQRLLPGDRVRTTLSAGVNRDRIHDLSVDIGPQSAEADIGRLVIPASRRAPRPMNRQWVPRRSQSLLKRP